MTQHENRQQERQGKTLRVAIIGASGIGRNHARWFAGHGCEVVAFAGSSPASVSSTRLALQDAIGFQGRGYTDVNELLRSEKPDAVCVSSPPHLHFQHVMESLQSGAHVLCEKPLVGGDSWSGLPPEELIESSWKLVEEAKKRDLVFGTQMQYATCVPQLLELCNLKSVDEVVTFSMTMETKNVKHGRTFDDVWLDLSPHPLSTVRRLFPTAELDWLNTHCEVREHDSEASFHLKHGTQTINVRLHVAVNAERAVPRRTFQINGFTVDYSARNNERSEFRAYLQSEDRVLELPDFVDTLVGNFVRAIRGEETLWVSGEDGAQVVEWQLKLMQKRS
ncbi:MAG TPA: Gfo/Idh/MocA family oxidoreductase [Abditibacteriaceae bacterium]|nr:Gfo/Idh/MocA family oxidoreductase [Abditibacteriaceae bacterium]